MQGVEQLPADWQPIATAAFVMMTVVFAAWSRVFGKKEGPATPKVQEFAVSGQLADMGPVKELIEQTGLLVQQQVRTNLHLEATSKALTRFADLYEHRVEDEQRQREISDEVERRLRERGGK